MTIAAGYTFSDGVMLCADTEMSAGGLAKFEGQKIIPIQFGTNREGPLVAFAITGSVGYAQRAVEMCQAALRTQWSRNADAMHNEAIRNTIEGSLIAFYKKFMYGDPFYKDRELAIELLIGLRSHVTGRTSLLVTQGPTVRFVTGFEFCGIGAYFARYACGKLFRYNMSFHDITLLAAHVLGQTKANVPDCGKRSQFVVITNDGRLSVAPDFEITFGENYAIAVPCSISPTLRLK